MNLGALVKKNGEISKTSVMLWMAFLFVAVKYLLNGMDINGWVVTFDVAEALTLLGLASGTYVGSNALTKGKGKTAATAEPASATMLAVELATAIVEQMATQASNEPENESANESTEPESESADESEDESAGEG